MSDQKLGLNKEVEIWENGNITATKSDGTRHKQSTVGGKTKSECMQNEGINTLLHWKMTLTASMVCKNVVAAYSLGNILSLAFVFSSKIISANLRVCLKTVQSSDRMCQDLMQ